MKIRITIILFVLSIFSVFSIPLIASEAKTPVIVTTAGQDTTQFAFLESMARLTTLEAYHLPYPFDFSRAVNSRQLEEGVGIPSIPKVDPPYISSYFNSYSTAPVGTKYKTIIFSIEYMEAYDHYIYEIDTHPESANITPGKILLETIYGNSILRIRDIEYEYERIKENILWAKNNEVYIVGLYLGRSSDVYFSKIYDKLFDIVIPACDVMIIHKNAPLSDMVREKIKTMDNEIILYELETSRYLSSLIYDLIGY